MYVPDISTALIIVTRAHDTSLTQTLTTCQINDTSERPNHALAMCLAAFARVFQEDTVGVAPTEDRATVRACFQKTTALLRIAARIPEEMNMGEVTGFGRRKEKTKVKKRSRRDAMKHLLEVCSSCDGSAVKLEEMKKVVMELDDLEELQKIAQALHAPKPRGTRRKDGQIKNLRETICKKLEVGSRNSLHIHVMFQVAAIIMSYPPPHNIVPVSQSRCRGWGSR